MRACVCVSMENVEIVESTTFSYSTTIYVPSCGYLIFIFIEFCSYNKMFREHDVTVVAIAIVFFSTRSSCFVSVSFSLFFLSFVVAYIYTLIRMSFVNYKRVAGMDLYLFYYPSLFGANKNKFIVHV